MKSFFYFLLIGIAILGLSGLNGVYAGTNDNAGQINSADINKITDFVQKYGRNVSDGGRTGREIIISLGWEQDHPEWTNKIPYHFLIKGAEVYKISGETKTVFHQLWLSPADMVSFVDNPQFQGLKEIDLFYKRISTYTYFTENGLTRTGEILWVFYYRDNLREIIPLSSSEAKNEFSKELNWWIEFIDKVDKK